MLVSSLLVAAGLVILVLGSEVLVRSATKLAQLLGVPASVIGLTLVAAGTSMPELVVSLDATLSGRPEIAVGNVVGSNIFNIAGILGLAALIAPLRILGSSVRREWPVMMAASVALYLFARGGVVDRLEGAVLLAGMVGFTVWLVHQGRSGVTPEEAAEFQAGIPGGEPRRAPGTWARITVAIVVSCALLAGGSKLLVLGATQIAADAGLSETVIGLTVIAIGTSLPELATSCVASLRGRDDIAVTNVLGSNVFNILAIVGVSAASRPLTVPAEVIGRDMLWMLGLTAVLLPLMRSHARIGRLEGAGLLGAFVAYQVWLLAGA